MKKFSQVIAVFAMLAIAGAAFGFTPDVTNYSRGNKDGEITYYVVGGAATIKVGQWVGIAFSDTQGFDTGSVVCAVAAEGGSRIVGVAEEGGTGGQFICVRTNGYTVAYINGSDSGASAAITQGTVLAASLTGGAAGAASTFMTAVGATPVGAAITTAQASQQKIVGIALEPVASTDTGLYHTYSVRVMCR